MIAIREEWRLAQFDTYFSFITVIVYLSKMNYCVHICSIKIPNVDAHCVTYLNIYFLKMYSCFQSWRWTNERLQYWPTECACDVKLNSNSTKQRGHMTILSFKIFCTNDLSMRLRGAIGSAFDSRSKGCVFESRRGHDPFYLSFMQNCLVIYCLKIFA